MIGPGTAAERALRESAIAEAADLFAYYGDGAEEIVTARIHDPALTPDERRRYRLARLEVERLGRERRNGWNYGTVALWRPPLFSWRGIKSLFRRSAKGTTRADRR